MKKQRWAVTGRETFGFVVWYGAIGGGSTRDLARIQWYPSRAAAERSFSHSQWVVVPEADVLAELVAAAVTEPDDTLYPSEEGDF